MHLAFYNTFSGTRINRNIVECKCITLTVIIRVIKELIETLWNVNKVEIKEIKQKEEPN